MPGSLPFLNILIIVFFPPQERRNSDREEGAPLGLTTENTVCVRELMLAGVSEDIITLENGLSFLTS